VGYREAGGKPSQTTGKLHCALLCRGAGTDERGGVPSFQGDKGGGSSWEISRSGRRLRRSLKEGDI